MSTSTYSDSAVLAAQTMANQIRNRNRDYRAGIATTQENAAQFATVLKELVLDDDIREELQPFLEEQKRRLIKVAENNAMQQRDVNAFCAALAQVQQVRSGGDIDYEKALARELKKAQENTSMNLELDQEAMVREVKDNLGMIVADADSDLEVMADQGHETLKCPISGGLFEEPVKNRVCKHIYSKAALIGILQQNRGRSIRCPMPGCKNSNLTLESCVPDKGMEFKVRKARREADHENELRMSQALDCEDFDDEEEAEFHADVKRER